MDYTIQHNAFKLLESEKFAEAVDFLDAHKLFNETQTDWGILKLFNNYLIACVHSQQIEKGVTASDRLQDVAPLNPHIYHNAACIYCKAQNFEKALAQIKLARKYGDSDLISILKDDADLVPIASHPDFKEAVLPLIRKYPYEKYNIPFEGFNHFHFNKLQKNEMISLFFIFKNSIDESRNEKIKTILNTMTSKEEWQNVLVECMDIYQRWRDGTFIGKDFITLHLKNIFQPKPLLKEAHRLMLSFDEELVHAFFVKRELETTGFGTINRSVSESSLPIEFYIPITEKDFWESSFSYSQPYPSPEYTGQLHGYGHHDGSETGELRTFTYDPFFRISYGLVQVSTVEDNDRSQAIFQFIQNELGRYFEDKIPVILNPKGEHKVDRITAHNKIGYAIEILNDDTLEMLYTRYVLRKKEEEIFKILKDTIAHFNLTSVIHWHRSICYTFHLWDR